MEKTKEVKECPYMSLSVVNAHMNLNGWSLEVMSR